MIAANSLAIQFGEDYLFKGVTFIVNPGDRIGLVGSNGAGKTTLMRILIGTQEADEGEVNKSSHAIIGYLPQEGIVLSDSSVREEVMKAFGELTKMEEEITQLSEEVARRSDEAGTEEFDALLHELGDLQHRFESMNGFSAKGEVEKILMGLGFQVEDFDRSCETFSGGWQMRIELAKLLLQQPDLLMLDEPTNHLDIESLTWLESFLKNYQGGILLISHDRAFLDALTNRTFELTNRRLTTYTGNYSKYLEERSHRRTLQQAAFENQQKIIADTERFIERFRYKATKATQVQSRVKALEKLERVEAPEPDEASVHFKFPPAPRGGRVAVELEGLTKRYGDNLVLKNVDYALERGEKVAFLGRNGEGKSTLSKIVAGIEPYEGKCTLGHNTTIGYFAQHQAEELNPKLSVLETLEEVARGDIRTQLRSLLGAFLFRDDDVFKKVSVLSGGEKSRLALAKLLLEPVNFLIFDEPTNHLDMASKGVLKQALIEFDGSMIIVSHDRDFLRGIVGKCIEFRNQGVKEHIGGIDDYLAKREAVSVDDAFTPKKPSSLAPKQQANNDDSNGLSRKELKRREAELRNKRYAATKELRAKLQKAEKKIEELELQKVECEEQMAQPSTYEDPERSKEVNAVLATVKQDLAEQYQRWERYASQLEQVEAEFEE